MNLKPIEFMSLKSLTTLAFCAVLFFTGCKKNVPGPQGDPGINGKNGNSNISSTVRFIQDSSSWSKIPSGDIEIWETSVSIQQLTQNAINNGFVKVYVFENDTWWPLPYTEGLLITQATFSEGVMKLNYSDMHFDIPDRPKSRTYRVVVQEPKL